MARYVLLRRGQTFEPRDLTAIAAVPGVSVVEHTLSRGVLVDASEQAIETLRSMLRDWVVAEEVEYPKPSPAQEAIHRDPSP